VFFGFGGYFSEGCERMRMVKQLLVSHPTIEGAGVRLRRAFGYHQAPLLDPFLLLDDFGSSDPEDYVAGFPWHPHRGIETVTYMLQGEVEHGDSLGNNGVIRSGDVQWMTAGSGIIHQEMPRRYDGLMRGFQLWVNLPASEKMMPPRYRGIDGGDIPTASPADGVAVKVIAGTVDGTRGPVRDLVVDAEYIDVQLSPGAVFRRLTAESHTVFAYVVQGSGYFSPAGGEEALSGRVVVYGRGTHAEITAGDRGVRFLLASGQPLNEPVAWRGPIVMNTGEELRVAFQEYQAGTFIKHRAD
jgi:redox-sensitive bicupin YhaK (pirin superfamily)